MDSYTVQRVLVELTTAENALALLEHGERTVTDSLEGPDNALSPAQREEFVRRQQFQLGRIEGLVQAQLALASIRQEFTRRHRPGAAKWPRETVAPAGDAGL